MKFPNIRDISRTFKTLKIAIGPKYHQLSANICSPRVVHLFPQHCRFVIYNELLVEYIASILTVIFIPDIHRFLRYRPLSALALAKYLPGEKNSQLRNIPTYER